MKIKLNLTWIILPALIALGFLVFSAYQYKNNSDLETYNRQLSGDLTSAEQELQSSNHELGVLRSQLLSEKELSRYWENSKSTKDKEFVEFIEKHNLKIKSLDNTIARLNQKIKNGQSDIKVSEDCVVNKECVIAYSWRDKNGRFVLKDPNIFKPNDELFESHQIFAVTGVIAEQKDGSLQVRRVTLNEVYLDENGEYQPIPDAKANIIDSDFQYHNPPAIDTKWKLTDIFRLRVIVLSSVSMLPDAGHMRLGMGLEFLSFVGIGINTHTAFDFKNAEKIEQRIGVSYNPSLFGTELNLAIGASVGTPFAHMFNTYSANLDFIFYINN